MARARNHWGLRNWFIVWAVVSLLLGRELWLLNYRSGSPSSLFWQLSKAGLFIAPKALKPGAGAPLGYTLGWIGFIGVLGTNAYLLRKRLHFMQKWGTVRGWLDTHIFFGIMGPTFIVFHSNFKIGGLVAIAFWSMMVSVSSGVIGRYLYLQILGKRSTLEGHVGVLEKQMLGLAQQIKASRAPFSVQDFALLQRRILGLAFGPQAYKVNNGWDLVGILGHVLVSDIRVASFHARIPGEQGPQLLHTIKRWALSKRRVATLGYFREMMGYWHSFHLPFAIFMYVVAVIHIIAVHLFRVSAS